MDRHQPVMELCPITLPQVRRTGEYDHGTTRNTPQNLSRQEFGRVFVVKRKLVTVGAGDAFAEQTTGACVIGTGDHADEAAAGDPGGRSGVAGADAR